MKKTRGIFVVMIIFILIMSGCSGNTFEENDSAPTDNNTIDNSNEDTSGENGSYNGDITLEFTFGKGTGKYKGNLVNGLPEGYGEFTTKDSNGIEWTYKGEWKKGHFNGEGKVEWVSGKKLIGTFVNDEIIPISETEIKKMFKQPENYRYNYIEVTGSISNQPIYDNNIIGFAIHTNINNKDNYVIVYIESLDLKLKVDDKVKIKGIVSDFKDIDGLTVPVIYSEYNEIALVNTTPESTQKKSKSYKITDTRAKTWIDSIGTIWLQTIIEIENTGTTNLYLKSGAYDIEDASGGLIASKTMVSAYPNVLAPGEKGYMYDETTLEEAVEGEITVLPREDVEEATADLIRFPVTDVKISADTYSGVKMLGRVENTSGEEQDTVYVVAILYDSNGACIGQMFTILMEDISSGDKIGFEMSSYSLPDHINVQSISDYVVYAYPLQFQFD